MLCLLIYVIFVCNGFLTVIQRFLSNLNIILFRSPCWAFSPEQSDITFEANLFKVLVIKTVFLSYKHGSYGNNWI